MLIVDVFSSDKRPPHDERRTMCELIHGEGTNRLVLLEVAGGMMDLGWAQRSIEWVRDPCRAYVEGEGSPSADAKELREALQRTLDRLEIERRLFSSAQFVAIELASRVHVARIGAARVSLCGASAPRTIGREDAWAPPGLEHPVIVTACLRPTHRWNVSDSPGWTLVDETAIATKSACVYREETFEVAPSDVSLVVMSHTFWAELPEELPRAATHAEIAKGVAALADAAPQGALAAVVLAHPV